MIDFVNLVDSLLEEQLEDYGFLLIEGKKEDIYDVHFTDARYTEAKDVLTNKYGPSLIIPSRNDFKTYITLIANTTVRGGINPTTLPNIAEWFPIFDLLCLFNNEYSRWTPPTDIASSKNTFDNWKTHTQTDRSTVPMEYTPLDPDARIAKGKLTKDTNLGSMRVDSIQDDNCFFAAASYLLDVRRTVHDKSWPKFVTKLFDTDGRKVISNILYNPKSIITGTYKVDKKLEVIFDFGITRNLVSISLSFYNMFKKELNAAVDIFINQIDPTKSVSVGTTAYYWKDNLTDAKAITINALSNNDELYKYYMGSSSQKAAQEFDFLPFIIQAFATSGIPDAGKYSLNPAIPSSTTLAPLDPKPYFKEDEKPQTFMFRYSFANLKNAARGDYPEAKELYKDFQGLGDYLQTKEKRDILGGATQALKGLSLGVRNMGT